MTDDDPVAVTRRYMAERSVSLRATARAAGFDPSYLSKVLNGSKPLSAYIAARLDTALSAGGAIGRAVAASARPAYVQPRTLVAPELASYFGSQLAGHYRADRFLGPRRLIPMAMPQYELLCDLASAANGKIRKELWSVAAGFAAFIGWLYQDGGDLAAAGRWLDVMIERAHRSRDPQLVAFALHNKAMLSVDMNDGCGALDLAGAALQRETELCSKVRILLLQQAAHGTSLAGGDAAADACERLLDHASQLLNDVDDDYPWGASCQTPRFLDVQHATVLTRLGHGRSAVNLWASIIPDIPDSSHRDLGVFQVRQAQALADAGEPDQAIAVATKVVPVIAETGSARMRAEMTSGLRHRMNRWKGQPQGRAMEEILSAIRKQGESRWSQGTS